MTATITTIPALTVETAALETVTVDIYRDIHKGIRNELFAVTYAAGRVDPADTDAVERRGDRWRSARPPARVARTARGRLRPACHRGPRPGATPP